eukprot:1157909-Pelagomonas_calceolata.AAC.7
MQFERETYCKGIMQRKDATQGRNAVGEGECTLFPGSRRQREGEAAEGESSTREVNFNSMKREVSAMRKCNAKAMRKGKCSARE